MLGSCTIYYQDLARDTVRILYIPIRILQETLLGSCIILAGFCKRYCLSPGGGGGYFLRILDRGVPRRFVNPSPI